jgi:hypothetical protein
MSRTKSQLPFSGPPLTPPVSLSEAEAKVFRKMIGAVDPDHFNAVDLPLIVEYCRCTVACDEAADHLRQEGSVVDGKANAWCVVAEKNQRALVAISARLRICPQSRFDRLVAGTNSRARFNVPWADSEADKQIRSFANNGRPTRRVRKPIA